MPLGQASPGDARGGGEVGQWWQRTKVGAGPIPIETDDGWLMIYHGVMDTCNGFVYSMGAALLDLDQPWKVLYRTNQHICTPEADYEVSGHVPNVVFPCAALVDRSRIGWRSTTARPTRLPVSPMPT